MKSDESCTFKLHSVANDGAAQKRKKSKMTKMSSKLHLKV